MRSQGELFQRDHRNKQMPKSRPPFSRDGKAHTFAIVNVGWGTSQDKGKAQISFHNNLNFIDS